MIVVFTISMRQWQNISPHLPPVSESTSCCLRKMTSLFEARKVAGSATYQQNETVLSGVVLLRSVCSFSPEKQSKSVCLVCSGITQMSQWRSLFLPQSYAASPLTAFEFHSSYSPIQNGTVGWIQYGLANCFFLLFFLFSFPVLAWGHLKIFVMAAAWKGLINTTYGTSTL